MNKKHITFSGKIKVNREASFDLENFYLKKNWLFLCYHERKSIIQIMLVFSDVREHHNFNVLAFYFYITSGLNKSIWLVIMQGTTYMFG